MTNELLTKKLNQALTLLEECIAEIGEKTIRSHVSSTSPSGGAKGASLSEHILALRDEGFFTGPKTMDETYQKLSTTYHCERKRVGVELIRLQKKRQLRKNSKEVNGKKLVAYVW